MIGHGPIEYESKEKWECVHNLERTQDFNVWIGMEYFSNYCSYNTIHEIPGEI